MVTLTQIYYNKLCESPENYMQSKEGRKAVAKIAKYIKLKEGRIECKYFLNLFHTICSL